MDSLKIQNVKVRYDRANLLSRIANRIRHSLELPEILRATAAEVQSYLGTDRVKIYKFHSDGSGEVIAESVNSNRLPSLLGLHFPADDIPPHARELFAQVQVRSIVDIDSGLLGQSPRRDGVSGQLLPDEVLYRPIDPCHAEYLTALGVKASLAVPIFHGKELWGLLVSHHSESRSVAEEELQGVQMVADQLAVAIAQSTLLSQTKAKAEREAALNRVAAALHSQPAIELQAALAECVAALDGIGGRLCIFDSSQITSLYPYSANSTEALKVYTCGPGPRMPISAKYQQIEQYSVWHEYFNSREQQVWAIADLYKISSLRSLQPAFRSTKIRSILIAPLRTRQQIFGYLSIFREEFDTETLWAGQLDADGRLAQSRISFEAWKESKTAQIREWEAEEIQLLQSFGCQFSHGINQYKLYQEIEALNANLENQVQKRTAQLQQLTQQQRVLFEVVAKMRKSLDLNHIFTTMSQEVRRALNADRVGVYRFDPASEFNDGEFVAEDVVPDFISAMAVKVHDRCFGENYAHLYSQGRVHAMSDIRQAALQDCFLQVLEQFQIKATLVAPVMKGSELWGLLCVHQCSAPRNWESSEIQFVTQVSAQLSIALEQADLLAQTQQQAVELQQATEQQRILFEVVAKIRESLDIKAIFKTATQEVCQFMQVDRIAVYRFNSDWSGKYVAEFVKDGWIKLVGEDINTVWENSYLQEHRGGRYLNNEILVVDDIYQACHSECHFTILEHFQVKAYAIAPIFVGQELWGLLAAYEHSGPRCWESSEVKFLAQIANQLGVAIQQADLLEETRGQSAQIAQNLKDLQQTQAQLIQTEKMSGLGQLVAGIAHEINNPVNFIYGNLNHATDYTKNLLSLLELYQQQHPDSSPEIGELAEDIDLEFLRSDLPKLLFSMQVGADRIRQIVLSLRNFSRLDESQMKAVDIHEGLDSTLLILQHRLKSNGDSAKIVLVKEYGSLPLVECYAGQLNQVFMNVIGNAIDAFDSDKLSDRKSVSPQIKISTAVGQLNGNVPSAVIRISDNGSGISESMRQRIFDPFFTTKPVGKGTGLGLSISYKIVVEKHGGVLKCSSESGKGTEFAIEIPISQ
ncbi:MAG: GAF domain-containing protein [Microcoleus sp. PH2017_10_PVI_O_A]|uniref:GAF domain-containing sensor histidine kinase n=1 Tax=unclassified Microcoleus TaxID=2642155 RepID=UPI001D77B15B|nr:MULTISPECIES: GAF domain-containing protein [unclassified Microcoleus]TAE79434.1 MAG: GAF domain-containing protein [Oscillatoriales cyanobacterium]MCC3408273.1 GAF domain-containing protein [Microcoleus sp. PH2017_10_PVI_O_A]MCC3461635.1 GAF domain-containing protein [Microcoleus sp. PH2017_11_PCY_U_A]MCC3480813.1 GAF domain-containing protein [Microcoleus sp. PH2017_12_PCY_D_A]MCC3561626.1 GAF domain-containing protein [Microcoleus sp. PH2017_27_LUM_O_A]